MTPKQLQDLGDRLCQWHSSGSDPVYAVGSFAIAGQVHERAVIVAAKTSLEATLPKAEKGEYGWTKEDAHELRGIIADLNALLIEQELDEFTRGYIDCAFWSETDEREPSGGQPLEDNYTSADLSDEARAQIIADCGSFQAHHAEWLKRAYVSAGYGGASRAGHDFMLTRNGHGVGFWDRGLGEVGELLSDAARACGSFGLYAGDDGKVYHHG